jgi:hypothetical protein
MMGRYMADIWQIYGDIWRYMEYGHPSSIFFLVRPLILGIFFSRWIDDATSTEWSSPPRW